MAFPTPNTDVSTATETTEAAEAEAEPEEKSVYETLADEHIKALQDYWQIVEAYRGVKKLALTHLFEDPSGVSNADIAALKDRSPLAEHFVFYREAKNDKKDEFRTLREDGDIPKKVGLRDFKEEVEPDFDYEVLNGENAADFGVNPAAFYEDEDEILVPDEYDAPTDNDGNLVVWKAETGDEVADDEVMNTLQGVDRIGEVKAEEALEALKEAGYKVVHN